MVQSDMPQSRNGKPKQVITTILKDLDRLRAGSTIKVPLTELAESKEKVRSPLSRATREDRKSTRLNSSHGYISYAVFCLKKKITYSRFIITEITSNTTS